ncbi:MAG TPA: biotin carboxylase N-terminal domain-containing protein [Acidimicrobiales bacterium]|nr:biotin carboxylase N-terminal domain-containing protein [Acidimicrobiales bacterium]
MTERRVIRRLLIANRGEIARRVMRTCRDLGIATVAVYSDPDANEPFVRDADLAVPLGGATPAESYLRVDAIVDAAKRAGADAVHPGYGFLAENAGFARACAEAGLTFVGPSPEAIDLMGSKLGAREIMENAGVPVLPGVDLTGMDDAAVAQAADKVGWPVLVKASYGGGGRGMRVVRDPGDLLDAVAGAKREAGSAFGNDTVFLERYVDNPRHVEIQIMGDEHGTVVHLNERECSIQRRHQKIIEEAPSPVVDETLRAQMGSAAVIAGKAIEYVGAGTVEFLLAPTGEFFFLEVNTRIQVEHPVTELVTGLDLVRLQLLVAQGDALPPEAHDPPINGWAIEARLYAEDPAREFMPSPGPLHRFDLPEGPGVRIDSGFEAGSVVSTNYDPMLAKVITYAPTRTEAARLLASVLERARVHGVVTNRDLLVGILGEAEFLAGQIDTHYFDRHPPIELMAGAMDDSLAPVAALAAALAAQAEERAQAKVLAGIPSGWRNAASQKQTQQYTHGDTTISVGYRLGRGEAFEVDGVALEDVRVLSATADEVVFAVGGVRRVFEVNRVADAVYVETFGYRTVLSEVPRFPDLDGHVAAGSLLAPMPGTVVRVEVAVGDTVTAGQVLVVIEAMKMEHRIAAPVDGVVAEVDVSAGAAVDNGQVLVVLTEEAHE